MKMGRSMKSILMVLGLLLLTNSAQAITEDQALDKVLNLDEVQNKIGEALDTEWDAILQIFPSEDEIAQDTSDYFVVRVGKLMSQDLETWNWFFVHKESGEIFVLDKNGKKLPYEKWRMKSQFKR